MNNIRFFNDDQWATGLCSASSAVAALPAAATQNAQRTAPWRSLSEAAPWIKVDCGGPRPVTAGALADLTVVAGTLASIQQQWSDNDSTWTTFATLAAPNLETRVTAAMAAAVSHRYWRYLFTGSGNVVVQVGKAYIGSYLEPAKNFRIPFSFPLNDPSQVVQAIDGQRSVVRRTMFTSGSWKIEGCTPADRDALVAMVRAQIGPMFVAFATDYAWGTMLAHHGPAQFPQEFNANAGGGLLFWLEIPFEEAR